MDSSLTAAFFAGHNIIRILSSSTVTMWAGDLFLNHYIELFAKIEIFKFEENFDFEFRAFHGINVHFVIKIRIVHFLLSDPVVKVLFSRVVQCLVS